MISGSSSDISNILAPKLMRGRNANIELLRIFFMFLIVMLHYLIHGKGYHVAEYGNFGNSSTYPFEMILIAVGQLGVTGFMFIS